jgi:chaperone required for assembly of F1-ATPase
MTEQEKASEALEGLKDKPNLPQRFYDDVTIKDEGHGVAVLLDGKPVRTPAKAPFVVPRKALAESIGDEWRGQGERVDPATMPLTRLANSVIDGVKGHEEAVIGDILNYAGSDLICYRAEGPKGLVALQTKHWDPIVAWAKRDLGVPMRLAEGVMHVGQDPASLDAIGSRLASFDSWSLAALHVMTGLSGSALLALATALGRLSPE